MHHHLGALTVEEVHLCRGPEGKNKCFSNSSTATLENVLRREKKFSLSSSVYTGLTVQHKMLDLGGAGVYKNNTKKQNKSASWFSSH